MVAVVVSEVVRVEPCDERGKEMMRQNPMKFPGFPFSEGDLESAAVLLREKGGEKILPIYVGMEQGYSIWVSISGERTPRPITHDLMGQILETANLRIENVAINRLAEETFYAEISLSHNGQTRRIDSRPSDALALAVRLEAPILASRAVFEEAALDSRQAWLDHQREEHGLREKN